MTLAAYLDRRSNGSISSLAAKVGVSRMTIYNIMKGARARRSTAEAIFAATGGAVTLEDLGHALTSVKKDAPLRGAATPAQEGAAL